MTGNPKLVTKTVNSLPSDAARRRFLRTNIKIRTLGFGGEFAEKFSMTWSHKSKPKSENGNTRQIASGCAKDKEERDADAGRGLD